MVNEGAAPDVEKGTIAGAMEGLTNITKGMSGIIDGIFSMITKLVGAIMDASPLLQAVLKIVSKMFNLILLPIGNAIGRLLMPIAIKMARQTMDFMNRMGGSDDIGAMLTEGLGIALDAVRAMISVIMGKVLAPVVTAIGQAIWDAMWGNRSKYEQTTVDDTTYNQDTADAISWLGDASRGTTDVINQFGATFQTGNRMMSNSFSETVMAIYTGGADIANGFQSITDVLVIGTPKAIDKFGEEFGLAGARLVTVIDTIATNIINLVPKIEAAGIVTETTLPDTGGSGPSGRPAPLPVVGTVYTAGIRAKEAAAGRDPEFLAYMQNRAEIAKWDAAHRTASGGIVTRPTRILAGEAGPEAIIPLNKSKGAMTGQTINVNFHGDVYGMSDFESKVEKAVSKYSGRVRGAY